MVFIWFSYGFHIYIYINSYLISISYGSYIIWFAYEFRIHLIWISSGWHVDLICISYEVHMDSIWISYACRMHFICTSRGSHMDFICAEKYFMNMKFLINTKLDRVPWDCWQFLYKFVGCPQICRHFTNL